MLHNIDLSQKHGCVNLLDMKILTCRIETVTFLAVVMIFLWRLLSDEVCNVPQYHRELGWEVTALYLGRQPQGALVDRLDGSLFGVQLEIL